jgi:hypothetical protein
MIRMIDEVDDQGHIVTVEITARALNHIKHTERFYGFMGGVISGIVAGIAFMLIH